MRRIFETRLCYVVFGALALVLLSPYLRTGFYLDDSLNYLFRAEAARQGLDFWGLAGPIVKGWIVSAGRFYPLAQLMGYASWNWLFYNLPLYRVTQVSLVLANLFLFIAILRQLGSSRAWSLLAATLTVGLFQLRTIHDPIASYQCLFQVIFLFGMGSVLAFLRGRRFWSLLLLALCLLTYEVGFLFFLMLFPLASSQTWRGKLRELAPFIGLVSIYLVICVYVRLNAIEMYPGIHVQVGFRSVIAYVYQTLGAFPLVYMIFGRSGLFEVRSLWNPPILSVQTMVIGAAIAGWVWTLLMQISKDRGSDSARQDRALRWIFGILALGPGLFIALSSKHQNEVGRPGVSYLPVYLSYFGVAGWFALVLWRRISAGTLRRLGVCAVAIAALIALTQAGNRMAVKRLNERWPHESLQQ